MAGLYHHMHEGAVLSSFKLPAAAYNNKPTFSIYLPSIIEQSHLFITNLMRDLKSSFLSSTMSYSAKIFTFTVMLFLIGTGTLYSYTTSPYYACFT